MCQGFGALGALQGKALVVREISIWIWVQVAALPIAATQPEVRGLSDQLFFEVERIAVRTRQIHRPCPVSRDILVTVILQCSEGASFTGKLARMKLAVSSVAALFLSAPIALRHPFALCPTSRMAQQIGSRPFA